MDTATTVAIVTVVGVGAIFGTVLAIRRELRQLRDLVEKALGGRDREPV